MSPNTRPLSPRSIHRHAEGAAVLQRYLSLPTSTWTEERSEAMRYLARMQPEKRMDWLDRARIEAPHRRETWLDLAEELHGLADWPNLFWACTNRIAKPGAPAAISTTTTAGASGSTMSARLPPGTS